MKATLATPSSLYLNYSLKLKIVVMKRMKRNAKVNSGLRTRVNKSG